MLFLKGGQVAVSHCAPAVILAKHQMESFLAGSSGDGVRQLQHRQWRHGTCPSAVGTVGGGGELCMEVDSKFCHFLHLLSDVFYFVLFGLVHNLAYF